MKYVRGTPEMRKVGCNHCYAMGAQQRPELFDARGIGAVGVAYGQGVGIEPGDIRKVTNQMRKDMGDVYDELRGQ